MPSQLLNIDEVAVRLRVSKDTAYRLASKGAFPGVKVGRSWRFACAAIDAYLTSPTNDRAADETDCETESSDVWRSSPVPLLSVRLKTASLLGASLSASEALDRPIGEMIGAPLAAFFIESDRAKVAGAVDRLRSGETIAAMTACLATPRRNVQVSLEARADFDADGRPVRALFTFRELDLSAGGDAKSTLAGQGKIAIALAPPETGVAVVDDRGLLAMCSEKARSLFGDALQEGSRLELESLFDRRDRSTLERRSPIEKALSGERSASGAYARAVCDGVRYFSARSVPVVAGQNIVGAVCYFDDITESTAERDRLLFTEFSIRSSPDAVYWLDLAGRFIYVNDAACENTGYARSELLTMKLPELDIDVVAADWGGMVDRLRKEQKGVFIGRHKTKLGRVFPVEVTANIVESNGKTLICSYVRDITERRSFERTLEESESRFRRVITASHAGHWDWDIASGVVWYSERYRELLGYAVDDPFPAALSSWQERIHPDDLPRIETLLNRHMSGIAPYDLAYRLRVRSGEYRKFRVRGQAFWDSNGVARRMAGSMIDADDEA